MCIYKITELEFTFTELINTKKSNLIIGAIYRHHNKDSDELNYIYLHHLLDIISKECKSMFLVGKLNVDLLKYDHHALTYEFFYCFSSHIFLAHIMQPTKVTSNSKTLITFSPLFSRICHCHGF